MSFSAHRRRLIASQAALAACSTLGNGFACGSALAQARNDSVVLGIAFEPPSLDPTSAAAASISEVLHYNVLEGLTMVNAGGQITPLLAADWRIDQDGQQLTFTLRRGISFHDGTPFDAAAVKFSFERAKAPDSTNKARKAVFENIVSIATPDPHTVVLTLAKADPTLPFRLGECTAVILSPKSASNAATQPTGTGPFRFEGWHKGSAITLARWDAHPDAPRVKLRQATFRFTSAPDAQAAALLSGDIDAMPRFIASPRVRQFQADERFTVQVGATAGKVMLAINNRRKPFDDVRVRRAITHAIDRQAFIDSVLFGFGSPIGSHATPGDSGYVDLSGLYAHDIRKAQALLHEAGVNTPLDVRLALPPPPYARQGGELVAAMLARIGIVAKIENVDWRQWLAGPYRGDFDLTIVAHVEPLDYQNYANPAHYWGYQSAAFDALLRRLASAPRAQQDPLYGDLQRQLAADAVNAWICCPAHVTIAKKGLKGLWAHSPIAANDLAIVGWS